MNRQRVSEIIAGFFVLGFVSVIASVFFLHHSIYESYPIWQLGILALAILYLIGFAFRLAFGGFTDGSK